MSWRAARACASSRSEHCICVVVPADARMTTRSEVGKSGAGNAASAPHLLNIQPLPLAPSRYPYHRMFLTLRKPLVVKDEAYWAAMPTLQPARLDKARRDKIRRTHRSLLTAIHRRLQTRTLNKEGPLGNRRVAYDKGLPRVLGSCEPVNAVHTWIQMAPAAPYHDWRSMHWTKCHAAFYLRRPAH